MRISRYGDAEPLPFRSRMQSKYLHWQKDPLTLLRLQLEERVCVPTESQTAAMKDDGL